MVNILFRFVLIGSLLISMGHVLAQSSANDVLYRLDRTKLNVKVKEITSTDVLYTDLATPQTVRKISKASLWKVTYANGSTAILNAPGGPTSATSPGRVSEPATVRSETTRPANQPVSRAADQLVLLDKTDIKGTVVRRDDRKIYYTKPDDPTKTQYELLISRLDRIRYADGHEESFPKTTSVGLSVTKPTAPAEPTQAARPTEPPRQETTSPPTNYEAPAPPAKTTDPKAFEHVHLTIGPELAYFPSSTNKQWGDVTAGLGMNQNVGGSVRFDFRFIRAAALSFTGGYNQWQLVRNYLQNGTEKYDETIKLTRIPLQAGLKLYVKDGFYLMPEAGINLLSTSVKTSATHPSPSNAQSSASAVTYGGSLGYEIRSGGILVDLSARYQLLDVKNLNFGTVSPALTERIQFASIRLGIGLNALRK